ncbi:hypothetical protein [Conexibacter sp. SYSU D00693]|uniref:hypothetical protein n=1 Tax=Conexibacter sp. SYSU D00693 TaxID=2812560 RepID=UPI00196B7105|nr:hypothetical protein [Conexibacter sp. SYSU D00693]
MAEKPEDFARNDPVYGSQTETEVGGENAPPPDEPTHQGGPADEGKDEPLGPFTPDDERPAGDTPEAHDEISPHDLPPDHPGRLEAERLAGGVDGTTKGNV